jgi:multidrug efflux pump subunit AcrA (membrane-fusion protein)
MNPRIVLVLLVLAPLAAPQEQPAQVKVVAATKGTVRQTLERAGTFVPADAAELQLDLEHYDARRGGLRIEKVLPHGSFVNKGDIILRLDSEAMDRQVHEAKMALERAQMAMRHAEEKERMDREADAEKLARAEVDAQRAAKRLRGFREYEKAFNEESERLQIEGRQNRLDDQKDELDQLEKMYSEDELVDATEEIVLKRSRRNFARSRQSADLTERRRVYSKEFYESWREEDLDRDARTKAAALARLRRSQEMGRERDDRNLEQQRYNLGRQGENFAELQLEKEQFTVRAPRSGILLHGPADAKTWRELEEGDSLGNRTVFASVADPKEFKVLTDIAEKDVLTLKANAVAEVVPNAASDAKVMGRIRVDFLPEKPGSFKAEITLDQHDLRLRPGLTAKVHVILAEERDAVLVPAAAVEKTDEGSFLKVGKSANGPFEKRAVVTGVSDGKHVAIRDGVAEGEFVVVGGK